MVYCIVYIVLERSIFADIIPEITINIENVPENISFLVPSQIYKFGKKVCEICPYNKYDLRCFEYIPNDSSIQSRCGDMKYYTYPGKDKIFATKYEIPFTSYVNPEKGEYEYSSEKEEVVKSDLKIRDGIQMNKVYDDIYNGINDRNRKIITSYNMSVKGNGLFLFTSNECCVLYKENDNRMRKIVYNYKLYGDDTLFTFNDVNLDETKTIFYFTKEQIAEENITKGCIDADKEYSYSELKTVECIKYTVEKYINNYGKPIFYISNYIHFQKNSVYITNNKYLCIYYYY